ncbi:MAG: DUF2231 domain-containing protein [Methylococcaceae bacterium]
MFGLNDGYSFQVHSGGEHGGGVANALNDLLVSTDGLSGQSGADMLTLLLPGIAGMANIHPLVVHFPIALLVMFFLVELAACLFRQVQWQAIASGLLYLGTLCAAITVYLGFRAAETVAHDEAVHGIMEQHEGFGVAVLSLALFLSLWRWFFNVHKNAGVQGLYLVCAALLNVLLVLGADLGGVMVYQHGVAVNRVSASPIMDTSDHDHEGVPAHSHEHGEHHH